MAAQISCPKSGSAALTCGKPPAFRLVPFPSLLCAGRKAAPSGLRRGGYPGCRSFGKA